jgi:murein DD-endopeptidase MepM/ murein hydrolase activator NlpD
MLPRRISASISMALVALLGFSAAAGADPIDDARRRRDEAQTAAVVAAQRYVDALSEQARQEAEIARLEREIPALRAHAEELRKEVRDRAVDLYRQGGQSMPITEMISTDRAIDVARAEALTASAAEYDRELAAELTRTAAKLEREEARLRELKALQDVLVLQLARDREALDRALANAHVALERVEAVAAFKATFTGADAAAAGAVETGASVCPIYGAVAFVNDWGAPRSGGRTHQGNDLFNAHGTPNLAVMDGEMEIELGGLGGISVWVHGDDGVSYYYAHLSKIEGPPRRVARGDVIGFTGATGNAAGGPPHTHFGIRAPNGQMVNPYPTLKVLCGL